MTPQLLHQPLVHPWLYRPHDVQIAVDMSLRLIAESRALLIATEPDPADWVTHWVIAFPL